jgi:hypothetical protein
MPPPGVVGGGGGAPTRVQDEELLQPGVWREVAPLHHGARTPPCSSTAAERPSRALTQASGEHLVELRHMLERRLWQLRSMLLAQRDKYGTKTNKLRFRMSTAFRDWPAADERDEPPWRRPIPTRMSTCPY